MIRTARELEAAGVDVIQFDEPAFTVFHNEVQDWGVAALERAAEGLRAETAVDIWLRASRPNAVATALQPLRASFTGDEAKRVAIRNACCSM